MFQTLKEQIKRTIIAALPFLAVFAAVTLMDMFLQREMRSQLAQSLDKPLEIMRSYVGRPLKWGLILSMPALFLGRRSRFLYYLLWPYLVFVETIETVARCSYGMVLDGDWLMIVMTSSAQEMREFFGQFSWYVMVLTPLGFLAATIAGLLFFRRVRYPEVSKCSVILGLLAIVPLAIRNNIFVNPAAASTDVMYIFLPVDTAQNYSMYQDIARTAREPRLPQNTLAAPDRIQETLGVFVIGESATRTHWHLYGYERPTTPMIDSIKDELVVFKDVRTLHPTTCMSLRSLFTEVTRENPHETRSTFAQQCAATGYTCSLFSSHPRWGRWEGVEPLLFTGCKSKYYLPEQENAAELFDDALLPPAEEAIRNGAGSGQVVFLHLMGSHFPPLFRYPVQRSVYPRYKNDVPPGVEDPNSPMACRVNLYDNTIVFTDLVLSKTIEMIKKQRRPSFLVYLSDHGETPNSDNWRDVSSSDTWTVPFIIWFSPEYRERYPETVAAVAALADEPRGHDQLLPIFRVLTHLDRPGAHLSCAVDGAPGQSQGPAVEVGHVK